MVTSPRVLHAAIRLARVVPLPVLHALAAVVGTLAAWLLLARRRTVRHSLRLLRPTDAPGTQRRLTTRLFRNLATAMVDLVRLPSASREEILSMATATGLEHLDAALAGGRGAIIVSGHFSAYELTAAWLGARGYRLNTIVEVLAPDVMNALARYREVTGMKLIPLTNSVRGSREVLAAGGIVVVAADRAIGGSHSGLPMPWGAGMRPIPQGAATFSLAMLAPIVILRTTRYHGHHTRYAIEIDPPLIPAPGSDRAALTRVLSDRLATFAIDHPDEWFVFQPQWVGATEAVA